MARLTEQEQQDIIRFIEADKPLPEKYRFLLFEDKREVELVWNGKTSEVSNVVLPFQTIEQVDEPRAEKAEDTVAQQDLFSTDSRGRQLKGWTNKLIWGDNKLILSSLKNGPLREEIERQGGLKLIYIDPPFDVGADFSMDIEIGGDTFTKKPNILEEIAYRDTWGKGADSFIAMIYERLVLMRDLLAEDGSIYVHCDWRVSGYLRLVLDEVFGKQNFQNEIIWFYPDSPGRPYDRFVPKHDNITRFSKGAKVIFNADAVRIPILDASKERYKTARYLINSQGKRFEYTGGAASENGKIPETVWKIAVVKGNSDEKAGYPTQKPEALLERIVLASSHPGDLVADFFAGSGTTAAVAEKLGRKWIASDLGKFAVHTTRKRLIGVQRGLKAEGKDYRAFEILNLGKYERQHYVGVNPNLRDEQRRQQLEEKEKAFLGLILRAYRAEQTDGFVSFQGKRAGRLVAVGPVNMPVSRLFVEEIILECRKKHITKVDILGFEFEMGLFPNVLDEARSKGIDIAPKYIPADVFDKRAVEKNQVVFHDVSFIEVKPHVNANSVAVELTDFSVFYSQNSIANAEATLKDKDSKMVVERGQIVKVSKDKDGIVSREILTKNWIDWIDYWSVDFDFENKREIIRTQNPTGEWEESWTGDYIFENEWQSFRTRKDRKLELTSVFHECSPGRRKIAVKVVDIFGNDTMTITEVTVGAKK
ncbi:adenine-specific DNA-methyltransferase (plasmid) [Aminobacter sp. Y103A]|uniref:DNA methyltransferase n=1 Tax=Aminobacter sp. Y103A TaxID=1870862 RepID=UPI0025727827|nr:site-specific DNA-methyltransferase [Aminobacter sp. SS-2016]BBD41311.1 adenine-specific DNA-methyltransferase [Aminobacter sp. SS-2016]